MTSSAPPNFLLTVPIQPIGVSTARHEMDFRRLRAPFVDPHTRTFLVVASHKTYWYVAWFADEAALRQLDQPTLRAIVRLWGAKHSIDVGFVDEKGGDDEDY